MEYRTLQSLAVPGLAFQDLIVKVLGDSTPLHDASSSSSSSSSSEPAPGDDGGGMSKAKATSKTAAIQGGLPEKYGNPQVPLRCIFVGHNPSEAAWRIGR